MAPESVLRVTPSYQDLLQCPICYEIPRENIFQCVNGHTICSTCCSKVRECPFCKVSFWTQTPGHGEERKRIRALGIESMLDAMTFECRNKRLGCQAIMKRQDMDDHLRNHCKYKTIYPPPPDQIVQHQQTGDNEALRHMHHSDSILDALFYNNVFLYMILWIYLFLMLCIYCLFKIFLEAPYYIINTLTEAIGTSGKLANILYIMYLIYLVSLPANFFTNKFSLF